MNYKYDNISPLIPQIVKDDISAVSIAPFSLPSNPNQSEDEESSMSSTSCPSPSSPIGGS